MSARNQVASRSGSQRSWEASKAGEEDGCMMIKWRKGKCNEIRGEQERLAADGTRGRDVNDRFEHKSENGKKERE